MSMQSLTMSVDLVQNIFFKLVLGT